MKLVLQMVEVTRWTQGRRILVTRRSTGRQGGEPSRTLEQKSLQA
jgi:hypothetical protein